jgi:CheY-like chemotaxis protein
MNHETRRRIFEPFYTTKASGHGLGLAAVLGIVRAHGGGLRLTSSPGQGARFQVLWPMSPPDEPVKVVVPAARTVLVIDDEDLVRDVVARMIEDLGYSALTACDGASGLEVLATKTVDAVLVDLTMPRMSGADVVATLRKTRPSLPVILCTGFDRDRRGHVEADAYLPKPFRIEALEKTLASIFAGAPR